MNDASPHRRVLSATLGLAFLALGACSDNAKTAGPTAPGSDPRTDIVQSGAPGLIVICADGPASFTASVSPAFGTLTSGSAFSLASGACATAWTSGPGDAAGVTVSVTQTGGSFLLIEAVAVPPIGNQWMTINQATQTVTWPANFEHGGGATFHQVVAPPPPPDPKKLTLCKEGPSGTFTFTVSATGGSGSVFPNGNEFTIVAGECKDVWYDNSIDQPNVVLDGETSVTVTEVGTAPLDSILKNLDYEPAVKITGTRSVTSVVNYFHGGVLTYYNAVRPPRGGQGCTPGYWKQSQHFGNWTSPYVPTGAGATDFDAAFGVNAFTPNITLLAALGRNGGGINALARHAAAALLNAANTNVSSDLEVSEVIAMVQAAVASGDYETTKNVLAQFNEQGCPLARNP